jgi:hypothetical protein
MTAIDALPRLSQLTVEQAEHWVAAALAEARALRQHDDQLFPATHTPAALEAARELHAAWSRWSDAAAALYDRLRPLLGSGRHVNGAADLDYTIGRTRAMLQVTPESYLEGEDEARRGNVVAHTEIRRELRDRMDKRRAAGVQ